MNSLVFLCQVINVQEKCSNLCLYVNWVQVVGSDEQVLTDNSKIKIHRININFPPHIPMFVSLTLCITALTLCRGFVKGLWGLFMVTTFQLRAKNVI